jgi:hypothetical protein
VETRSERDDEGSTPEMPLSGPDIFLSSRPPRRAVLPTSLRRARAQSREARMAQSRANHPCQGPRMYGESETTRIELRRRFEDVAAADAAPGTGESAAG